MLGRFNQNFKPLLDAELADELVEDGRAEGEFQARIVRIEARGA